MDPFQDCINKGRVKQIEPDVNLAAKELETAREELQRARAGFSAGRWDETVTQGYFALHRCARAAIASHGYKDTNLYGLLVALEHLFVTPGLLPPATTRQIRQAKDVKDSVYDNRRATFHEARQVLQWSQDLAKAIFIRLALPGLDGALIDTTLPEAPARNTGSRWGSRDRGDDAAPRREGPPREPGNSLEGDESLADRALWRPPRQEPRGGYGFPRRRTRAFGSEPPLQSDARDDQGQPRRR
jgi:uncharacterized protein (UPF0332 family)